MNSFHLMPEYVTNKSRSWHCLSTLGLANLTLLSFLLPLPRASPPSPPTVPVTENGRWCHVPRAGRSGRELGGGTGTVNSSTPVAVGYERPAGGSAQPAESWSSTGRGTCVGVPGTASCEGLGHRRGRDERGLLQNTGPAAAWCGAEELSRPWRVPGPSPAEAGRALKGLPERPRFPAP